MSFDFSRLTIPDVFLIQPRLYSDNRGFFVERYKKSDFDKAGLNLTVVQENLSYSTKNVVRGLHYQLNPHAQAKLVGVASGEIFDVAVDIRRNSPTFAKWVGQTLTSKSQNMLFIPEGFAHGFCTLSEGASLVYHVNREYSHETERGIRWDDPTIAIDWPIDQPIVSEKDMNLPLLKDADYNF